METRIQFDCLGIGEVIKRHRLRVPLNQREYAWELEHVQDLLTDIANAMQKGQEVYFLGTLVLTTTPQGSEVADGQQRLATTTIICSAIRDVFLDLQDDVRAQGIQSEFLFTIDLHARERISRLMLNADDNEFFCSRILAPPKERNNQVKSSRRSHVLLESAFDYIKTYFGNLKSQFGDVGFPEALLRWIKYLTDSATVITMVVPNDQDAFVMFETLNDRGLKTSQADLVKNHLFKEASDRRPEAQVCWSSMRGAIEALGDNDLIIDFLRHVSNLLYGQTRERDVFEKIKGATKGAANAVGMLTLLGELAQDYAAILNPEHPKWNSYPTNIRQHVRTLSLLNVSQIRPLMLAAARHFEPNHAVKAFERFVAWTVRFIICGGGRGGDMERNYCDMANAVHVGKVKSYKQLESAAVGIVPKDSVFQTSFETVRVNVNKLARYYLRSLEQTASGQPNPEWIVNDAVVINLEHIMPSTPSKDWPSATDRDIEAYANRMGNLVLLQADINSDIDKDDFATKRKAYQKSSFLLTSQVAQVAQWTVAEIEQRQKVLADLAVKTWKIS